ncbi:protein NEN1-like [Neltuma alba]|uniref:protein NEN1-like n=1 Tax=Neltuma alba TaxID=207710 RepID=UPI0010A52AFC|nr:protein NEN1-like [Prosopis alba]XP_028788235.1 protein NEN1-like [Prosopis alba]
MDHADDDRPEIVFFDLETIHPTRVIVEFGAILICPKTLKELQEPCSTLVRPADPSLIPAGFQRSNGITSDSIARAPTFAEIADDVYKLLHDRIWAGHNMLKFDSGCIREAFTQINRPPPEPKGFIDSLVSLTETFGRRAGNMTLATLAEYFGLEKQTHRSLDDVRTNIEVIKCCATAMFLESSLVDASTVNSRSSAEAAASHSNEILLPHEGSSHTIPQKHFFTFGPLRDETNQETIQAQMFSSAAVSEACTTIFAVLKLHQIAVPRLTASSVRSDHGDLKIQLRHEGVPFQLCCDHLKILFGVNDKFFDRAGLPKLSIVVDLHPSKTLCEVLEACDSIAKSSYLDPGHGGNPDYWRPLVAKSDGFYDYPTVRLRIPTAKCGNVAIYAAEMYQRDSSSGTKKRMFFDKFDVAELGSLLRHGSFVDAVVSFDFYEFQENAGIRLIAKALTVHSN